MFLFFFPPPLPQLEEEEGGEEEASASARGGQEGTASEIKSLPLEPRRFLARAGPAHGVAFRSHRLVKWL